jgi:hypothetical protein
MGCGISLEGQAVREQFCALYGAAADMAPGRYRDAYRQFVKYYGGAPCRIFSAPGRI